MNGIFGGIELKVVNAFVGTAVDVVTEFFFSKNVAYHTLLCFVVLQG